MSFSLSCGIVGLPNVGKSTLFNALTGAHVLAANYPFATIEPNTGVVQIPDNRLTILSDMYQSERIVPATVTFVDIAGLVKGASTGEGLGNQFLSHIRGSNAIIQVVRAFNDNNVLHVDEKHSAQRDIETINTELVLADLQTVDKRLPRLEKELKADSGVKPLFDALVTAKEILDQGIPLRHRLDTFDDDTRKWIKRELQLLTFKPVIYLFNTDEAGLSNIEQQNVLTDLVKPEKSLFVCAKLESELGALDASDAKELLTSYGVDVSGLVQLIHSAYDILNLQSYLTAGKKEVRAWTIPKGATAPQAAGVIHTDFERGFIAAQVVNFRDLVEAGSEATARAAGKIRTEGKEYVMAPDDVVEFRFNVSK